MDIKSEQLAKEIYNIFINANTLNDMGDTYFPEQEVATYLEQALKGD